MNTASKYKNRKVIVDGIPFDSLLEARRYAVLRHRLEAGEIHDLRLQPRFTLVEGFRDLNGSYMRPLQYVADFSYITPDGVRVVEDTKGARSEGYKIKRKLMRDRFSININEITKKTVEV